jgi:OmpA-OmpF porin, OOP family
MKKATTHLNKMLSALAILLLCQTAFSQKKHEKWELGILLGASQGQTDLQNFDLKEQNFGFGGLVRYHFTDNLGLRFHIQQGKLTGDDANYDTRSDRGFSYESPVTNLGLVGEWDILGKRRYRNGSFHRMISPYLLGGIGYGITNPKTNYNEGSTTASAAGINADKAEGAVKGHFGIPVGAGLKIDFSPRVALNLEAASNRLFGDYLDGVSEAGNPDDNDTYSFLSAGLSFRLNGEKDSDGDGISDEKDACPNDKGTTEMMGCPDRDGDGVADQNDLCPDMKGLKSTSGCPDRDGDGIADDKDDCPDNKGTQAFKGCPDTDGDGIQDKEDNCPTEKGTVSLRGCPDTDGDGIADKDDMCPKEKGTADNKGCPVADRDKDGIADKDDACPDKAGTAAGKGCPDTDGDGVYDNDDRCVTKPGPASNKGCPELKQEDKVKLQNVIKNVQFETGSDKLLARSNAVLDEVVAIMNQYPEYSLTISGHTDNVGDEAKNLDLSKRRAKTCYDYLAAKGVAAGRMTHNGFGEAKPVADNNTKTGRDTNRRVDFDLTVK